MITIKQIAEQINSRSKDFEIGKLQELRTKIKNLGKHPTNKIFNSMTIFDEYAFHYGGRKELQYNIGIENEIYYRHGVAFSLQRSHALSDVTLLYPKIRKFNEFMRLFSKEYSDMMLWYYDENGRRSVDYKAGIIVGQIARPGAFIFLGKLQKEDSFSYDEILKDFDRLLPLYSYVEDENKIKPEIEDVKGLRFIPGCTAKKKATKVTRRERTIDIDLRHNMIQEKLHGRLVREYGKESVGTECQTVGGKRIDVVVRLKGQVIYCEIKTALTAKTSIRESLSQLLEYSYWPGGSEASELLIISEAPLDAEAEQYLKTLREKFSVPIYYEQVKID